MMSARARLTPQMLDYAEKFDDRGEIRWLPYLMYFHPADHRSAVVNTDRLGFRVSHGAGATASVGGTLPPGPVRLLAGSSTVFGIGATNDAATLPSRLWARHAPAAPWLNFGGRSYNSTQELLLFVLYRHLLEQVEEVVLLSGFNDLGLSRLPAAQRGDHGAFFNSGEYFEQMQRLRVRQRRGGTGTGTGRGLLRRGTRPVPAGNAIPGLAEQISLATELTIRHLDTWRAQTEQAGVRLTYVLQPLATWVRPEPAPQERLLFEELDKISNFQRVYGDIAAMDAGRGYASALQAGCAKIGVRFLDLSPVIEAAIRPSDWLFVDRIHFTDAGYDLAAELLADSLGLT
jgi:hypothetical protein